MDAQKIQIKCKGAGTAPISKLEDFQGNLKKLTKENYDKLKRMILELGFSEPISVWKNDGHLWILNGHQRLNTLRQMSKEGFIVPEIPINFVEADDYKQAKKKVLSLTSQFGEMEDDGLYEFSCEAGISATELLNDFRFPEIDLKAHVENYYLDNPPEEKKGDPPRRNVTCPECGHVF